MLKISIKIINQQKKDDIRRWRQGLQEGKEEVWVGLRRTDGTWEGDGVCLFYGMVNGALRPID